MTYWDVENCNPGRASKKSSKFLDKNKKRSILSIDEFIYLYT
tara:strand:- start:630 stop:755 length:126 start_codon:yes stop_codon:yes gene_type:complete